MTRGDPVRTTLAVARVDVGGPAYTGRHKGVPYVSPEGVAGHRPTKRHTPVGATLAVAPIDVPDSVRARRPKGVPHRHPSGIPEGGRSR